MNKEQELHAALKDTTHAEGLASLLRSRIGVEFDGEAHLTDAEAQSVAAAIERLVAERDEAREALLAIDTWAKAYPLSVFPEPDFALAAKLLKDGGLTLDAVSASNMRHVLTGIQGLVAEALKDAP